MKLHRGSFTLLFLCSLAACAADQSQNPQPNTAEHQNGQRVLVRFKTDTDVDREAVHETVGATLLRRYSSVPGLEVVILNEGVELQEALRAYNNHPQVEYAEPDATVTTQEP